MRNGWPTKTLGEVCHFRGGGTPSKAIERYWQGDIPWVSPKDMKFDVVSDSIDHISHEAIENGATSMIPRNAVLIVVRSGILARTVPIAIAGRDLAINQDLKALCPTSQIDTRFLSHVLHSRMDELLSTVTRGATVYRLATEQIRSLSFALPPLPEQHRIVRILDEAFEGIAIAKANAEKNLQNARAIFESHLQAVFTQRGEGWEEKKLGDTAIVQIIDGDRGSNYPSKEEFSDDGFCLFLNTKNVRPDGFNFNATQFISEAKDKVLRKGKLQRQDVVLTTRGTIGNVAIYDEDVKFENIRINSGMLVFRPNTERMLPSFLFEVFRSGIMKGQMVRHVSGAAQPQLPIKTLSGFGIPVPNTIESQRTIVASVRVIDAESRHLESIYQQKLASLDALKKSLLHQAFTGNL